MANLTGYIEHTKEQQFHWQIVELKKSPLQELHDAPILYICAEQVKDDSFGDADKKKLRDFTDTGGTILFEASCGNPGIRKWFQDFAREVWPEWPMKALGPDHGVFTDPNPLKQRPEILGVGDGVRTSVFYAMDDVSCAWQQRAMANKDYLFKWGINLYTYATDGAALRAKLANPDARKSNRYNAPVKGGGKSTIKIARMKHGGNWESGANYGGFGLLAKYVKDKAAITLDLKEPAAPFNKGGVEAKDLAGNDVAFITGSNAFQLTAEEKEALKTFVEKGGALWLEASTGANAFDQSLQKLAADMQWQVKLLQKDNPLATGRLDPGLGYDLTQKVEFSTWFRKQRLGRTGADIYGVFQGDKMIGVYSPLDVIFSITGHEAWHTRGYQEEDAAAVGTNIVIYFSTLK
jgi:hypothetical protein